MRASHTNPEYSNIMLFRFIKARRIERSIKLSLHKHVYSCFLNSNPFWEVRQSFINLSIDLVTSPYKIPLFLIVLIMKYKNNFIFREVSFHTSGLPFRFILSNNVALTCNTSAIRNRKCALSAAPPSKAISKHSFF